EKLPPLGKNWVSRFIKRHPGIKTVLSAKIDKQRWDCVSKASCEKWFGNFEKAVREYHILDSNIYNMDEKGCVLGLSERAKVLIPSDSDVSYKQQPGNRESVTIIESVNGVGDGNIVDFIRFYAEARQRAFTRENICSSFSESGLVPFNPSVVYGKLISEDKRPQTPESSSRPSSSGQLKTPGDFAGLLSYCRRLEKCIEEHGIEDSPTRKLSKKVSGGVLRQGAEFAILQKENTAFVTLAQVHQIREEEKRREAEKEEAAESRKVRVEEAAKKKAEKAEESRKKAENAQKEKTSDVEDLTLSFLTLDISGSEDDTQTASATHMFSLSHSRPHM
ncbi:hypothetical protein Egran_02433, partial [Elaphomyces granulatus]